MNDWSMAATVKNINRKICLLQTTITLHLLEGDRGYVLESNSPGSKSQFSFIILSRPTGTLSVLHLRKKYLQRETGFNWNQSEVVGENVIMIIVTLHNCKWKQMGSWKGWNRPFSDSQDEKEAANHSHNLKFLTGFNHLNNFDTKLSRK